MQDIKDATLVCSTAEQMDGALELPSALPQDMLCTALCLGARASGPHLKQARRLRSQGGEQVLLWRCPREPVRLLTPPRVSKRRYSGYAPGCGKAFMARMRQWLQALLQPAACAYCQIPFQPYQGSEAYNGKRYHASCLILLKRIVEQKK